MTDSKTLRVLLNTAKSHLAHAIQPDSARVCWEDAEVLFRAAEWEQAKVRATKSLAYSVGVFHPDYPTVFGTQ